MTTPITVFSEDADSWFDLSVVTDQRVRKSLDALLTEWRMRKRWHDMVPNHLELHRAILRAYLATGLAPERAELVEIVGGDPAAALDDLATRDLILLEGDAIVGAYPFTSRPSHHRVEIGGQVIAAMCAIDALGAGAMARSDANISAVCAGCGSMIRIKIAARGLEITHTEPDSTMIWAGVTPVSGCAADTQCQTMLMFCNTDHLEGWRAANAPGSAGFQLTPAQALELGAAIFRPFLPNPDKKDTP